MSVLDKLKKKKDENKKGAKSEVKKKKLLSRKSDDDEDSGSHADVSALANKGYESVTANQRRIDQAKEQAGNKVYRTWLPDGETKTFRFHNSSPITWNEHRVQLPGNKFPIFVTCLAPLGEGCHACDVADGKIVAKSRFVGGYLVQDRDKYKIKSGERKGEVVKDSPRLFVEGQNTLNLLAIHAKKGLTERDYEITRTDKSRAIVPCDKAPLSKSDKKIIKELLDKHEVESVDELILQHLEMQTYTNEQLEELLGGVKSTKSVSKKLRNF